MSSEKTALLASYSAIDSDPRVRRQVDWLAADGWSIDTIGLGGVRSPGVRNHYELLAPRPWLTSSIGYALTGRALPKKTSFRLQILDRVPPDARRRVTNGEYDLIVLNETEFLPWMSDPKELGRSGSSAHIHVDLHEMHRPDRRRDTLGAKIAAPYYQWRRRHIGHPRIDSRTVVNEPIGAMYVEEFGIDMPQSIRNVPPYEDLAPVFREDGRIRLLFHGLPSRVRGFEEIVGAMGLLPDHFEVDFMIMPNPAVHQWLQQMIDDSPASSRIRIVPPAPMREIAKRITDYDLEVIYYPHHDPNLVNSLPNKFFESIQARLGIVTREDGLMGDMVAAWGNGITVPGHSAHLLAAALAEITTADVERMKRASNEVALAVNAEAEGRAFIRSIGA